jgi:hypothetical protein
MRSARQAGFFVHGEDRLVQPAGPGTKPQEGSGEAATEDQKGRKPPNGGGGGGGSDEIDPIIRGLLARLPKSGDIWPEAERKLGFSSSKAASG